MRDCSNSSLFRWLSLGVLVLVFSLAGGAPALADDNDGDGHEPPADCNDNNASVHPGALEVCNGIDDNCDGTVDIPDPDPVDGLDNDLDGQVDEGLYFCVFHESGPGGVCKSGGRAVCEFPAGPVSAPPPMGEPDRHLTCVQRGPLVEFVDETIGNNNCNDGSDNDCDTTTDIQDSSCQTAEVCDGVDNDGDGDVDEGFGIGTLCSAGVGGCQRPGIVVCTGPNSSACSATPGPVKKEGAQFGNSCGNGVDDDCDGFTDVGDTNPGPGGETCAGFGAAELCNGSDDDGDGQVDEGFPTKGQACSVGVGACTAAGVFVCKADGSGTECNATAGSPVEESEAGGTCADAVDNDCDTLTDGVDADCASAFADLGVTCSLPYEDDDDDHHDGDDDDDHGDGDDDGDDDDDNGHHFATSRSGSTSSRGGGDRDDDDHDDDDYDHDDDDGEDCRVKREVKFSKGTATEVKAELLALGKDGKLLAIVEGVKYGEEVKLASRSKLYLDVDHKGHGYREYRLDAPVPLLRVTGRKGSVEDVAYCSILPYLEVSNPDGDTISLSEGKDVPFRAFLPLTNVDTLRIKVDGVDVLSSLGINPAYAFPTGGSALCSAPGSCIIKVPAGCGVGGLVDVELSDLRVEGLDQQRAYTAKKGIAYPKQVNTVSFTLKGLPAGGHIIFASAKPLPLPKHLNRSCNQDDLADTGRASAFGIAVTSPEDQEIVATSPVRVTGRACSGNPIASLSINGREVDVTVPTHQSCIAGNGITTPAECVVNFAESIPEKNLVDGASGNAVNASYKRGGNRVVADASDDKGNRTFNTDVIFGLGAVQDNVSAAMMASLPRDSGLDGLVDDVQAMMATEIDPAFVVGLEESAARKFFAEKCQGAIDQFTAKAQASLTGKTFATFDVEPDCSCNLNNVPIKMESLTFTPSPVSPSCAVDFNPGKIDVNVHLPTLRIQVGAHRTCTTHGIFGECLARTKVNVTAVTRVTDISFAFSITENQIETKTPPNKDDFFFTWDIVDPDGNSAILAVGHCANAPQRECYGNKKEGPDVGTSAQCDGGVCNGFVSNPAFDPVTQQDVGIECWGASICLAFEAIAGFLITVFTFGLVDGFDLIGFLEFDINFETDFLDELKAAQPDAMGLNDVVVVEDEVSQAGFATFTPGPIDVTIQDGGLTAVLAATFETTQIDPTVPVTPPAAATPASAPTVGQLIPQSDDVSMLVADDVFNRIFKAMQEAGKLKVCSSADALTVDELLPAAADGGCDSLGPDNPVGATLQGICHAIRDANCLTLTSDTTLKQSTKIGACVGFSGGACAGPGLGPVAREVCERVPHRNINASDSVLICARQDFAPDLTIETSNSASPSVNTNLFLEDLNVVFALDRGNDGFAGVLEDLPGCWSADSNNAADCRVYAACADLNVKTEMGIDSAQCAPTQAGFVFALKEVIPTSVELGAICSAGTDGDDASILEQAVQSLVTRAVADNTETFMPPICVDGLDLNGVLNFNSPDAKLFGLATDGGTGFADFLGITVGLGTP